MKHSAGVYETRRKDGTPYFRASLTYHNKHISLGSFSTKKEAHLAYRQAQKLLHSSRYTIDDYPADSLLSFEKWVTLINFRDNLIYIKNPIYLRKHYFLYYYDVNTILKFDTDDLFYYSNHKIMKRGGYLFVADYGMQENILSRYGIRSFSVKNRDYIFVNGDDTDFRFGNIEIINHYYGVQKIEFEQNHVPFYLTKIHVNGDIIVGRYSSEVEAAIAYNKAADFLRKQGCSKNFFENYIEEIDEICYAEIYQQISVNPKLENWNCSERQTSVKDLFDTKRPQEL